MDTKQASIKKTRSGRERKAIYGDIKELRKEYREREKQCVSTLVRISKVVLATLHGAGGYQLQNEQFDIVIIDEGSQALEAQCWIPLLPAKKLVLAGDHLQLPPTVKSLNHGSSSSTKGKQSKDRDAANGKSGPTTLSTTLFDRLLDLHGTSIKKMLTTQYRMHAAIMAFPSAAMYSSRLIAADSVAARLLKDLPYPVTETEDTSVPLVFLDTQGGDFPELANDDTDYGNKKSIMLADSKSNPSEIMVIERHVTALVEAGVREEDIAVITPYNAQVSLLGKALKERFPGMEVGSVDGFQGREKEAVVVGLVRSNGDGEVGFLGEERRLNGMSSPSISFLCTSCRFSRPILGIGADDGTTDSGHDTGEKTSLRCG